MAIRDQLDKIFYKRTPSKRKPVKDKKGNLVGYIDKKGNFVDKSGNLIGSFALKETTYDKHGNEIVKTRYISTDGEYEGRNGKLYRNGKFFGDSERRRDPDVHKGSNLGLLLLTLLVVCGVVTGIVVNDTLVNEVPVVNIKDNISGGWSKETKVKVFDEQIYPGCEGEYEFIINNDSIQKIEYSVDITQYYNGEEVEHFPILYRLKKEYKYLTGNSWVEASELSFDELLLTGGKDQTFVLEWKWPFEGESDLEDTLLGYNQGEYYIGINVKAEIYNGKE